MYSGFIEVESDSNSNLFFWFFRNDNDQAPLSVYLEGGPGGSSLGAVWHLSPLSFEATGNGPNDYKIDIRDSASWADHTHLLFVDNPIGVGFSYGDKLVTDLVNEGAPMFTEFMTKFYDTFTDMQSLPLHMTGQSFAGKYLPAYSKDLYANDMAPTSIFVGNPFADPINERL